MIVRLLFFVLFLFECQCRVVRPHQNCVKNVCYFDFDVDYKFTMMWYNYTNTLDPEFYPVVMKNGVLHRRITSDTCGDTLIPLTLEEFKHSVSPGDGKYRMVYAINGQIPGPDVVVFEDQIISVLVHNHLKTEGVTVHWHGMVHRGTPFMDGVDMVTQCPILPGQTFEYRFVASPVGTHWYHAHTNSMRNDGLAGALIVLPRIRPAIKIPHNPIPEVDAEFSIVLQEWTKRMTQEKFLSTKGLGLLDEYDGACLPPVVRPDGSANRYQLHMGLVNGLGRKYIHDDPNNPEKPYIPLETFTVKQKRYYRFRVTNVGVSSAFEISIDDHTLIIVAFDGNDVEPFKTDVVTISPAERVDFIVYTGRPLSNYYINFITASTKFATGGKLKYRQRTYGVLNYFGVNKYLTPVVRHRECTDFLPCVVVNQVYGLYPVNKNTISVPITNLKSTPLALKRNPVPLVGPKDSRQLFFLNFHLGDRGPRINGIKFRRPSSALQTYPGPDAIVPCGADTCTEKDCKCTHMLKLGLGNIIDFVLFSFSDRKAAHPVHLHGHHFHVLKIGYPPYDFKTGNATARNPDITCFDELCTKATWTDPSWNTEKIPGLNLVNPPIRDTVVVPANGYVIIRLKADNPGFWFMHCHFGHHQTQGMNLIMQEGNIADMPKLPPNFPTCNNFLVNPEQWLMALKREEAKRKSLGCEY
ncbi:uncharacterized protein LOC133176019 [Saccostrea echinata]|uniref:uncharacterized protein LOC133176019 n=1 Tax=Saccostrea echinata TaxID=191078 RepID=UPI002A838D24|nr:uncharacterized protein LOC133176019 [Saccostrea echinata]